MIEFTVLKRSKRSAARLGVLKTPHGEVQTPALVGVATLATIKALRSDEVLATGTQMLISNTYHLHLQPGEKVVKAAGGLNRFMNWTRPTMTDSGGFQVFSLGWGRDLGIGKQSINNFSGKLEKAIEKGKQPSNVKMTEDGVEFRSPLTGEAMFLGPEESMAIQNRIGADIMFAFDECPPPGITKEYMKHSLARTNRWAQRSLAAHRTKQALYGIVQGAGFKDLRMASARAIGKMDGFAGYGIGGDLGESKEMSRKILQWATPLLDERKPRHLLGMGRIEDIEMIMKGGIDTFDCTVPTHYARRGIAFVSKAAAKLSGGSAARAGHEGRIDFTKSSLLRDDNPIDPSCACVVCGNYRRNYIAHLVRANEIAGGALITFHNLAFFNAYIERLRAKIAKGQL